MRARRAALPWRRLALVACSLAGAFAARTALVDFLLGFVEPWFATASDVAEIASIDSSNGIDREEAARIASRYWTAHQDLICGGPNRPIQDGAWWTTCIQEGFAGERDGGCLRIHVRTGAITSTFARSYKDLEELHEHLAAHAL